MAVPSPTSAADKALLRIHMRARRRAFVLSLAPQVRLALEEALADVLSPLLTASSTVAGYVAHDSEISLLPALRRAAVLGKTVAFPSFLQRDASMTFRAGEPLDPGPWSILQPGPEAPIATPDLLLIPLMAIDRTGNRIGMGQGHYDRALPDLRAAGARLIGVGWDFQLVDIIISPDAWDIPLDGFASPAGFQEFTT